MSTMNAYRITNTVSGADLGRYIAESPRSAFDAMARDAGYTDAIAARVATTEPGDLCDYETAESIRPATAAEYEASLRAGEEGVITVDGRSCYVTGPEVDHELRVREIEISVVLRSGDTGLDTAEEYDAWTSYVIAEIDERAGVYCEVDVAPFKAGGNDTVKTDDRGDDEELVAQVRGAIASLWEDWCSEDTAAAEHRDAALDALRSAAPKLWREARDRDGASS